MAIGSPWGWGLGLDLCRGEGRALFWICQTFHQSLPVDLALKIQPPGHMGGSLRGSGHLYGEYIHL